MKTTRRSPLFSSDSCEKVSERMKESEKGPKSLARIIDVFAKKFGAKAVSIRKRCMRWCGRFATAADTTDGRRAHPTSGQRTILGVLNAFVLTNLA